MAAYFKLPVMALIVLAITPSIDARVAIAGTQKQTQELQAQLGPSGLRSLRYGGVELLHDGQFRVVGVALQNKDGMLIEGELSQGRVSFDEARGEVTWTYPWGTARTAYALMSDRVNFTISITNRSDSVLRRICLQLMEVRFPQAPRGWIEHYQYLGHNVGTPSAIVADFGRGVLALLNEEVAKPLLSGFPGSKSLEVRRLWVCSANIGWLSPMLDPLLNRPINPGGTDQYHLSLRFGTEGASDADLARDVYEEFAAKYPLKLNWRDRRPIAALFLSNSDPHLHSSSNPRGWFKDPKGVDVITGAGRSKFRARLLKYAEDSIGISKAMNAQGMIVWDLEGEEFPHPLSYLGDPRALPPEMEEAADEFFRKFSEAGLRTGITVRPQSLAPSPYNSAANGKTPVQVQTLDPAVTLINKIGYAKKRWGCTLFYIDSNGDPNVPFDALSFKRVADAHPDVLLIPEHKNTLYYAYTAPYQSLRQGITATPSTIRTVYPNAFSVIYAADGPVGERRKDLVAAVKRGDVLMFYGSFDNPNNVEIRSIYEEVTKRTR